MTLSRIPAAGIHFASAPSGKNLKYVAGLFAARQRGRALKGSQALLPPDNKNPQRHSSEPCRMWH